MSVFWQSVLAVFAAVGFYAVLHTVFEIVCAHFFHAHHFAELTLYGDGCDPGTEHLLRMAVHIRKQYLPDAVVAFVEIGRDEGENIARCLAERQDILYLD